MVITIIINTDNKHGYSYRSTAWVGSIPMSMLGTLALAASWVLNRYSLRLCTAVTAIPIGLSLLLTSYAGTVNETIATFSIPFGFSASMMVMIANKSIQVYFDKRLVTANGEFMLICNDLYLEGHTIMKERL